MPPSGPCGRSFKLRHLLILLIARTNNDRDGFDSFGSLVQSMRQRGFTRRRVSEFLQLYIFFFISPAGVRLQRVAEELSRKVWGKWNNSSLSIYLEAEQVRESGGVIESRDHNNRGRI